MPQRLPASGGVCRLVTPSLFWLLVAAARPLGSAQAAPTFRPHGDLRDHPFDRQTFEVRIEGATGDTAALLTLLFAAANALPGFPAAAAG